MCTSTARSTSVLLLAMIPACAAPSDGSPGAANATGKAPLADPTQGEVPLEAEGGWNAFLVHDNGDTGIWTVGSYQVFDQYACPEVVGLDDQGRCLVCVSYSGKWTPLETVDDGKWLGGLAHGDVDPRIEGAELYVGSQRGNLYQVVSYAHGALDNRLVAHLPGREIHTIVAGDLDPRVAGGELLLFTRPGALYRVTPTGPHGTFEVALLQELLGRVRDAVTLPAPPGETPEVATVSRAGRLELLRISPTGPTWTLVHAEPMGMGRIALAPPVPEGPLVLYTTLDDGRVQRHERGGGGGWRTETIHRGSQGPRGIAAGQFHAEPAVESVAIFGYSGRVELLTRANGAWSVETLFRDRDKGHWLAAAEVDGRNGTREILLSGYGARIVLLARPPGYGVPAE